jgi:hypothetical protein
MATKLRKMRAAARAWQKSPQFAGNQQRRKFLRFPEMLVARGGGNEL